MFKPDGRNDIQYVGHIALTVARYLGMGFALACILPTYLVIRGWQTMKRQDAGIVAINSDPAIQTLRIDFNQATLADEDPTAYTEFREANYPEGQLDPSLQSLPFTVTGQPAPWIYYNLPFDANVLQDKWFARGEGFAATPLSCVEIDAVRASMRAYDPSNGEVSLIEDPWMTQGVFKLAPTKWWDWYTTVQLVQAKASYNFKAYAGAARMVAQMRTIAADAATGVGAVDLTNHFTAQNYVVPARIVATIAERQSAYANVYRTAFRGHLPVVDIQTQFLNKKSLTHDPYWAEYAERLGESGWNMMERCDMVAEGPFITGIKLTGESQMGRPEFTRLDYLYRSTPYIDEASLRAQAALQELLQDSFWIQRFQEMGLNSPATLKRVTEILALERTRLARDVQFARLHGHEAYRHMVDF